MDGRSRVFAMSYTEVCEIAKTSANFRHKIKRMGDSVAHSSCKDTVSLSAENGLPPFATASCLFFRMEEVKYRFGGGERHSFYGSKLLNACFFDLLDR